MKLSLLHATRGRPARCLAVREEWMKKAGTPDLVEHIFGCDADDAPTVDAVLPYHARRTQPRSSGSTQRTERWQREAVRDASPRGSRMGLESLPSPHESAVPSRHYPVGAVVIHRSSALWVLDLDYLVD